MTSLAVLCSGISTELKQSSLHPQTVRRYRKYLTAFLQMAEEAGFTEPGQDIYDYFHSLDVSKETAKGYQTAYQLIESKTDMRVINPEGFLVYEPDILSLKNAVSQSKALSTFPVLDNTADLLDIIGLAYTELQKSDISLSSLNQYWKAWKRLYAFFYSQRDTTYRQGILEDYKNAVYSDFKEGQFPEWKKNSYIRSTNILIEVSKKGFFNWKLVHPKESQLTILEKLCYEISDSFVLSNDRLCSMIKKYRSEITSFIKMANLLDFSKPEQKLYEAIVKMDFSENVLESRLRILRLVDKKADSRIIDSQGYLLNEPDYLTMEHALFQAKNPICFPVETDREDLIRIMGLALSELTRLQLTESSIGQYWKAWRRLFAFFYIRGYVKFDPVIINEYKDSVVNQWKAGRFPEWKKKIYLRSANVLLEVADKGCFSWKMFRSLGVTCKNSELMQLINSYIEKKATKNLEKSFLDLISYCFRVFLAEAQIHTIEELNNISTRNIETLVIGLSKRLSVNSRGTVFPIVRMIMQDLWNDGIISQNFSGMLLTPYHLKSHLRPYITAESEKRLDEQLKDAPFRTKAIFGLARTLGLREIDIINLRFSEIDWKQDKITICQKKTGVKISFPLLPEIGNDLMDYILLERPQQARNIPFVFVRHQAPYRKLTSAYVIAARILKKANVVIENRESYGLHTLRHTLVHKLLKNKVPLQVITDVLGHHSKESDQPYISMDEDMLRMCPLNLSVCGLKRWEEGQNAGE